MWYVTAGVLVGTIHNSNPLLWIVSVHDPLLTNPIPQ